MPALEARQAFLTQSIFEIDICCHFFSPTETVTEGLIEIGAGTAVR